MFLCHHPLSAPSLPVYVLSPFSLLFFFYWGGVTAPSPPDYVGGEKGIIMVSQMLCFYSSSNCYLCSSASMHTPTLACGHRRELEPGMPGAGRPMPSATSTRMDADVQSGPSANDKRLWSVSALCGRFARLRLGSTLEALLRSERRTHGGSARPDTST